MKVILPGGAGLIGQNLVIELRKAGINDIVVLDKHSRNLDMLRILHPDVTAEFADLAEEGEWAGHFEGGDAVVMLQAQIGSNSGDPFIRNNLTATRRVLEAMKRYSVPYLVHVSSSVVNSVADDLYTSSKKEQEQLVRNSGVACVILRPTLMFGWFDRKHLGWLSRFMRKVPVFPIPGSGRYMRQPLYAGDFCSIIARCIQHPMPGKAYNITGLERLDYIDIIRSIKQVTRAKALIVKIPYGLFSLMLRVYGLFDGNPPFTAAHLKALAANEEFEVIDWPGIFGVNPTPFLQALEKTFCGKPYCDIELEF